MATEQPADAAAEKQQDVHLVLRVEATLRHVEHAEGSQPTADASFPDADPTAPNPSVDPATLALQVRFTPWVGQELTIEPALLARLGELSPSRPSTPVPEKGRASPAPAAKSSGKGVPAAPAEPAAEPNPQPPVNPGPRWWCAERHFKLTADETLVRAMAESHGVLNLPVTLSQPPAEPPPKAVKGQPPPPEPVVVAYNATVPLVCANLLLGDTAVESRWPSKLQPMPAELSTLCDSLRITIKCLSMPEMSPEEEAAAKAAAAKAAKAPAKGAKGAPPAEVDISNLPGDPIPLLTPALTARLNPLVIMPARAKNLPDAPATTKLIETRCEPTKLRILWPPGAAVASDQVGRPGSWLELEPQDSQGPGLHCRSVGFGQPLVLLAGEQQYDQLVRWCRECPLTFEVHDRTIIPEPPEFAIKQAEGATAQQEDEGYVCGIARISLLDLVRGQSTVRFHVPLTPHTTIRGAASLDWGRRPGNYAASAAIIKGWVRCAVPFTQMTGISQLERIFTRAVFTMDYRDSDLFHLLEDTIRQQNAWALGLAAPEVQPEPPSSPEAGAGGRRKSGSAMSSARNSRNSTPSRGGHSDTEGHAYRRADTSHSTHSVGPQRHGKGSSASPPDAKQSGQPIPRQSQIRISDPATTVDLQPVPLWHQSSLQRNSSLGARQVLWSAPQSASGSKIPDKKELRFHDFNLEDHESAASEYESEAESVSPAQAALRMALVQLETIKLDNRLLQSLSTTKLTPEQASNPELDLLTGWHVVDGKERIIAVEGRGAGAMVAIQAIISWALEDPKPEDTWLKRTVRHNSGVLYPTRIWADLGVDLHIVKLHAPLTKIVADANSYATGKVRVDCIAGLRRLAALRAAPWARLAEDLCLYPTPHMLHLVDKKFGGELTKADVFGVEVQEFDTDEEDGGGMGLVRDNDDVRSSHSSSRRSARSKKSLRSKRSRDRRHQRKRPALQPLDRHNGAYLAMRQQARLNRLATDWHKHNLEHIAGLTTTAATIRADWARWNPQRDAARKLEEAVKKGTITLEDTLSIPTRKQGTSGAISVEEARLKGWAPHASAFKWPAPKEPGSYVRHPHAPSLFRKEQLAEPWEESTATNSFLQAPGGLQGPAFITTVKNATGLFGQDPEYWKTVHMGGTGREREEAELREREKADWAKKLVADPVMRLTFPVRSTVGQTDRTKHILLDPPKKKGLTIAHVPPAPYSMHLSEPWHEGSIHLGMRDRDKPQLFTKTNTDFKRHLGVVKSAVSKAGHEHLQSWTASIHDARYQEA